MELPVTRVSVSHLDITIPLLSFQNFEELPGVHIFTPYYVRCTLQVRLNVCILSVEGNSTSSRELLPPTSFAVHSLLVILFSLSLNSIFSHGSNSILNSRVRQHTERYINTTTCFLFHVT